MKTSLWGFVVWMALANAAFAQHPASSLSSRGYLEAVAQSAFGNVTSQSFGGEIGVSVSERAHVFLDAGQVRDASPTALGASAQVIAGFLAQTQSDVTLHIKQPVTFGLVGVRYGFPSATGRFEPYLTGGAGVARVKRDVRFGVAGQDVTNTIDQYGIRLGTDLSGASTKPMLALGAGVAWPVWTNLVVDLQYRYGRIFTSDEATNVSRLGAGIGVRF